jgi:hypothetical protein
MQQAIAAAEAKVVSSAAHLAAAQAAGVGVADALDANIRALDEAIRLHTLHNTEIAKARAAQAALTAAQKLATNRQTADAMNLAARSPLEVFETELTRLNALMASGSGLSTAGYNTAVANAFAQQGSAEAQAAINAFNRQGGQANVQEQIKQIMQAAAASGAATAAHTAEIARTLTRGGVATVAAGPRLPRP